MENLKISDPQFNKRLNAEMQRLQLRPGLLQGVNVRFVLNALSIADTQPLNDRVALAQLWGQIIEQLGGKLVGFSANINRAQQGGQYVAQN